MEEDYNLINGSSKVSVRRLIIIGILILVSILLVWLLVWIYSHGRLSLEVNQLKIEPTIIITNQNGQEVVNQSGYKLETTLPSGEYVARVTSGVNSSTKALTIGRFLNHSSQSVEVIESLSTTPITNSFTYKPHISKTGLSFIDRNFWQVGRYKDSQFKLYNIPNVHDAAWIDDNSAYAVSLIEDSGLYKLSRISNDTITEIPLPTATTKKPSLYYGNGYLYLVVESNLYRYKDGRHEKLFGVTDDPDIIFITKDSIGLSSIPTEGDNQKEQILKISDLNGSTKFQENLGSVESFELWSSASLSDDGSMLAVGRQGEVTVYNFSDMTEKYKLPIGDVSAVSWDGSSLIYATSNTLWRYNPSERLSQSLTELLPFMNISDIIVDGNDIYMINEKLDSSSIFKLTKDTDINSIAQAIDGSETTAIDPACSFNYYNAQPKITIFVHDEDGNISRCIEPIRNHLRSIHVDPGKVAITRSIGGRVLYYSTSY